MKNKAVDSQRRSLILQSMDSFLGMEDDDEISLGDLQGIPPVTKPSIRKPGTLTRDDRSTSTEVTAALDDSNSSFDLTEIERAINVLPVSPYPVFSDEILELEEDCLEEDSSLNSSDGSFQVMQFLPKPKLNKNISIQSVDMDENNLRIPDLRSATMPPMRRTSISVPVAPTEIEKRPSRRSSVCFAEMAEVSFIDKLDATTDYDALYYNDEELADFRHKAFLEDCGIADEEFDD